MVPDQSDLDLQFLSKRLQNISADDKSINFFCDMPFKG